MDFNFQLILSFFPQEESSIPIRKFSFLLNDYYSSTEQWFSVEKHES